MAFHDLRHDLSKPSGDGGTVGGDPIEGPCPDPGESGQDSSVKQVWRTAS